jgi:hypothetical protein
LRCISQKEGQQLLSEIHSGLCSSHIGTRALVEKAYRQGFYWPAAVIDADQLVRSCQQFQFWVKGSNRPTTKTQLVPPIWPLRWWGIDIVRQLPPAPGNLPYAVVAVEYFSKWVEVMPLVSITSRNIHKFLWQNIVCHFGVPSKVTMDNGNQFDSAGFRDFCNGLGMKVIFASVYH